MRRGGYALAAGAIAAAVAACSPAPPPAAPAPAAPTAPAATSAPLFPPRPTVAVRDQPLRVRAHGVVQRAGASEALLAVDGGPAQVYPVGATVVDGWRVDQVAPDHVMLAKGDLRERLDVVGGPASLAEPPASQAAAAKPKEEPLPGFVKGAPPPTMAVPPGGADSNQRFRELHQRK